MSTICDKIKIMFSHYHNILFTTEFKILILGLSDSSKTSIKKCIFEKGQTTIVSNTKLEISDCILNNIKFILYDLSGDRKYRYKWSHYYKKCDILLFCVDLSGNPKVWGESKFELHQLIKQNSRMTKSILVLGTKNDKEDVTDCNDMINKLDLISLVNVEVACFSVSAQTGTNIRLIKPWIIDQYNIKHKKLKLNLL